MSIAQHSRPRIVVGVDTHKHVHVAVALDHLGAVLDSTTITVNRTGYARLRDWATALATERDSASVVFGIEGTGSYGAGLASFLRRAGDQSSRSTAATARCGTCAARTTPSTRRPPP